MRDKSFRMPVKRGGGLKHKVLAYFHCEKGWAKKDGRGRRSP